MSLSGKRVVITGGLGFIGSHLARALLNLKAEVTVIDSLIPEYGGALHHVSDIKDSIKINISDVRDHHSLKHLLRDQDYLFNLAGQTSHMDSQTDPFTDLEINAKSQLSILEVCRKVNPEIRVVFASTRQLYGRPEYLPVNEQHPVAPTDVNGINKLAGELYHLLYHKVHDINGLVLRLTNTYGPGMRIKDSRQTFLGVWIRDILKGEKFEVWEGSQLRDFNYVSDVVDAMILAAENKNSWGNVYNLGSSEVISLKDLADTLVDLNQGGEYKVCSFPSDRKKIDIGDYYSDFSKIKKELGWSPKVSLKAGLKQTLDFYRDSLDTHL